MDSQGTQSFSKRAISLALSVLFGLSSTGSVANAQASKTQPKQTTTQKRPAPQQRATRQYTPNYSFDFEPDRLMVTVAAGVDENKMLEEFEAVHCKLSEVVCMGNLRILLLETPKGKLAQAEKDLRKIPGIGYMQRNYKNKPMAMTVTDPQFVANNDNFLALVKAPKAWELGATGQGIKICIADTGCQATTDDIAGKTDKGYDSTTLDARLAAVLSPLFIAAGLGGGPVGGIVGGFLGAIGVQGLSKAVNKGANTDKDKNMDRRGHGTECATVAAGSINGLHGVGVAPSASIYPINDGDDGSDDMAMCQALAHLSLGGAKIVNFSQGPYGSFTQKPILHLIYKLFHDQFGGIIFQSAGNDREMLGGGRPDYVNVVSMTNPDGSFLDDDGTGRNKGSARGNCIGFAAQGVDVYTVTKFNEDVPMSGTSFSAPTCAGVAALIWSANPKLSNTQVENIMRRTAYLPTGIAPDANQFGYGIPDAEAAVKMAKGM